MPNRISLPLQSVTVRAIECVPSASQELPIFPNLLGQKQKNAKSPIY